MSFDHLYLCIKSPGLSSLQQQEIVMTKVLVLYYSAYGHIEAMANAVAAGARTPLQARGSFNMAVSDCKVILTFRSG